MNVSSPPIQGVFPAALTMFNSDGDLDLDATARHADYLIDQGVHGLVVTGTSGEFIALTENERLQVIDSVVKAAAGRVPVYAGTGHYSTSLTIELTQGAEELGADGAIVILPYYQKPPKSAVFEHFRLLRKETGLPLMLYNNPVYAGLPEFTPWDVKRLVDEGIIQSIKSTFDTPAPVHDLRLLCPEDFRIFYGSFRSALEGLLGGADGWVSGILNAVPAEAVALYEACAAGDVPTARQHWNQILPLVHLFVNKELGDANDLAIWRTVLEVRGQHGGHSRAPFFPLNREQRNKVVTTLQRLGLA